MQFVGDFLIDPAVCDRLVELHRACDRLGLVKRGRLGKAERTTVDVEKKDSFDVVVDSIPPDMEREYGMPRYYAELQRCLQLYQEQHPLLKQLGIFRVTESPAIQHYRPGGGFKSDNFWSGVIQGKIRIGGNTPIPLRFGNDPKRVQN